MLHVTIYYESFDKLFGNLNRKLRVHLGRFFRIKNSPFQASSRGGGMWNLHEVPILIFFFSCHVFLSFFLDSCTYPFYPPMRKLTKIYIPFENPLWIILCSEEHHDT
jgi:hypothetical protein